MHVTHTNRLLVAGLTAILLLGGCGKKGSGTEKTDQRKVETFTQLAVTGTGSYDVKVGGPAAVTIRTDDNLLQYVKTRVEGDKLIIETDGSFSTDIGINVSITAPTLTSVSVTGAAELTVAHIKSDAFKLSLSGASRAVLSGQTTQLNIAMEGASSVDAGNLKSQNAKVAVEGAAKVSVHAEKTLDVTLEGVGKVTYSGSPKVTKNIEGIGTVTAQ